MKRKRKKPNTKKEVSFYKEYNFEITVIAMFLLGVFLLVEKMEISQTLFKVIKATIFLFADFKNIYILILIYHSAFQMNTITII